MMMFTAIGLFLAAATVLLLSALWSDSVRRTFAGPRRWIAVASAAAGTSLLSILVHESRHSGTGWMTAYGWPKPFYFSWQSFETAERSGGVNLLYLAGNILVHAAAILIVLLLGTMLRVAARRR